MKLYIYDTETMEVVAVANGNSNNECQMKAGEAGYSPDEYGYTYSPAFGTIGGLIDTEDAEEIG